MMELHRSQVAEAKERREKNEAQPFKEAYEILKSIQGLTRWTDFLVVLHQSAKRRSICPRNDFLQ